MISDLIEKNDELYLARLQACIGSMGGVFEDRGNAENLNYMEEVDL